jgi:hypothetical protein
MPSSEARHGLLASLARQKLAVAGLVLLGVFYAAFLLGMKRGSVSIVQRVHGIHARHLASRLEELARELPGRPSATLPLEWNLPHLDREPHTVAVGFYQEDWGVRTDTVESTLLVKLAEPVSGDLELRADARPHLHRKNRRQEVHVLVNGERVALWVFTHGDKEKPYTARIAARLVRPGEPLRLTFRLPGVDAAKAILSPGASRLSGMGLLRLRLGAATEAGPLASPTPP